MSETVTVSKAELDTLRNIRALMDKAWDNKEVGGPLRQLLKKVDPALKIPEDVTASVIEPVNAKLTETQNEVKGLNDRLTKFLDETSNEKATSALRTELSAAQKKFGLDDEGMTKVMQRMKDKNNPDAEAAAAFVASTIPKPELITDRHGIGAAMGVEAFGMGASEGDDAMKGLGNGEDPFKPGGWFDRTALKAINETTEQAA